MRSSRGVVAVAAIAIFAIGAGLVGAVGSVGAAAAPAMAVMPGRLVEVRGTGGTGEIVGVGPLAADGPAAIGRTAPSATFVVTYHCFTADARTAFRRALDIWSTKLTSTVPITIDAWWTALPAGQLGGAGPVSLVKNFPNRPVADTWYSVAAANKRAGRDLQGGKPDITANFSSRAHWYFGVPGELFTSGEYDFTTTVLHEVGHGLGFLGYAQVSGGRGSIGGAGALDCFSRVVVNGGGTLLRTLPNGSAAMASQLQSNALYFDGANAKAANGGARPRLYAPNPWQAGSSFSHLNESTYRAGTADALMTPSIGSLEYARTVSRLTLGVLKDCGW